MDILKNKKIKLILINNNNNLNLMKLLIKKTKIFLKIVRYLI
jgi:hypothetical protein